MKEVFLLLGGNIGNRKQLLDEARNQIVLRCGKIVARSSLFETAAWGKADQDPFLNQAVEIDTQMDADRLLEVVLEIERSLGRERKEKYGPRTIDIDIIFFANAHFDTPVLTIPHPSMQYRKFVLEPLAEIAPNFQHPVFHKSVAQLLLECPDRLTVSKIGQ